WDPEPDGFVWSLVVSSGVLYAGGDFLSFGLTTPVTRMGAAAWTIATGALTAWDPEANGTVYAISVSGTTIFVGGAFTKLGNSNRSYVASLNNATGAANNWSPSLDDRVLSMFVSGTNIYVAGSFLNSGMTPRTRLAAFNTSSAALQAWAPTVDGEAAG